MRDPAPLLSDLRELFPDVDIGGRVEQTFSMLVEFLDLIFPGLDLLTQGVALRIVSDAFSATRYKNEKSERGVTDRLPE